MKLVSRLAENVARKLLEEAGWFVHHAKPQLTKIRGQFRTLSNDLWGCIDLACVHGQDGVWVIQVTTTGGRAARRRKVERVDWPHDRMRVSVFEIRRDKVGRRFQYWFRIHDLEPDGWVVRQRLDVPRELVR